jgi:hypothetical protein
MNSDRVRRPFTFDKTFLAAKTPGVFTPVFQHSYQYQLSWDDV